MTIYDKLYRLSKKLSNALLNNKGFDNLEESDLFSDGAKAHIKQNLSEEEIQESLRLLNTIDKEEGWERIGNKISPNKGTISQKHLSVPSFLKVAAAILILVSVTYLTFNDRVNNQLLQDEHIKITVGTDKAILTLEDGSEVALEKNSPFKNESVQSHGARLEYKKNTTGSNINFNYLTIPRGGQYQILLSDSTLVWLNSDTKLKYPVAFEQGKIRTVELLYGEAYFDVSPSKVNNNKSFKVITQNQDVEVLGTEFNIKAYAEEDTIYTTLVEGKVAISNGSKTEQLNPGMQSILDKENGRITTKAVEVSYVTSWRKGQFSFKDKPLKDIMVVLSRWYDVEVYFENKALEKIRFNGVLNKDQAITDILNGIKNTKIINAYEIKDKNITIK